MSEDAVYMVVIVSAMCLINLNKRSAFSFSLLHIPIGRVNRDPCVFQIRDDHNPDYQSKGLSDTVLRLLRETVPRTAFAKSAAE